MEGALTARDRVGIQDFVLLDAFTSESAFLDNLRKRFNENLIYVSLLLWITNSLIIILFVIAIFFEKLVGFSNSIAIGIIT